MIKLCAFRLVLQAKMLGFLYFSVKVVLDTQPFNLQDFYVFRLLL